MTHPSSVVRVLYSFPHPLGNGRIADTAWYQVKGLSDAGAAMTVFTAVNYKPLPSAIEVRTTLSKGRLRIPYKVLGRMRAFDLHDYQVAKELERRPGAFDIVHVWPLGALRTLQAARSLGIPTVLERPNAHTRFAYEVVEQECKRIGVPMPPGHEHAYNPEVLAKEEAEYALADWLLCPSEFVARTFRERGYPAAKLARHQYGYNEGEFSTGPKPGDDPRAGITMLYVGGCAPRKGLHFALEAWLASPAHTQGKFKIAGAFIPGYAERLAQMLADPSVEVLGHRNDIADLMRESDILVLPSIEEGSALVTSEARGSGCVLLVSDASGAICEHETNALVHAVGDVVALTSHLTRLHEDRGLLRRLRENSLARAGELTWGFAGERLLSVYRELMAVFEKRPVSAA
jgi:glycosyltransferase involved in cell wall biosynthesis